ncbi:nitronate monooxygenase [Altererythrobacter arenosus]|uniref:Nitronate monooxygenase n=1 Tax=Altererythrobacter arenosus TaxID=3032592 RepID=A0ABY8FSI3_9SPHN|nr:nitronate monooxygenase [Altererythrobacter sp. CAU 1644]WFL77722.1 nitronate monooxygenase [Altererythrobacter sp. CAU 1644]
MPISTRLTKELNIRAPIVVAPMAGISGGALAYAVGRAGGFGFVAAGYLTPEKVLRELALASGARHGVGFITWRVLQDPAAFEAVLERKPEAVFLSFGDAGPLVSKVRKAGALLFMQVQSLAAAREAASLGADVIVAQGSEAGGHGASRALGPLVDEVVNANLGPIIIAAGGISNGRGLAANLVRGASGALIGTAFYPARESLAHSAAKQRALAVCGDETERTNLFDAARGLNWPDGWTLRVASNVFSKRWRDAEGFASANSSERANFADAASVGDFDIAPVIVGEGVGLVERIETAADIISRIEREAEDALRDAPQLLR